MPDTKTKMLVFTTQEKKIMMPKNDYQRFTSYLKDTKGNQINIEEGTFTCHETLLKNLPDMEFEF